MVPTAQTDKDGGGTDELAKADTTRKPSTDEEGISKVEVTATPVDIATGDDQATKKANSTKESTVEDDDEITSNATTPAGVFAG